MIAGHILVRDRKDKSLLKYISISSHKTTETQFQLELALEIDKHGVFIGNECSIGLF